MNTIANLDKLNKITSEIINFIQYIDKIDNKDNIDNKVNSNLNYIIDREFSNLPKSMIKLLMDKENRTTNLEKILDMIKMLQNVNKGEMTLETAENEFAEKRAEEYLYPIFGGKEEYYKIAEEKKKEKESNI
jgi:hypothetical protein